MMPATDKDRFGSNPAVGGWVAAYRGSWWTADIVCPVAIGCFALMPDVQLSPHTSRKRTLPAHRLVTEKGEDRPGR